MTKIKWFCGNNECREPSKMDGQPCRKCGYTSVDFNENYVKYNLKPII